MIIAGRAEQRAAAFCRDLGHGARSRRIDVDVSASILLRLGDEYGPDSLRHVLEAVAQPFSVIERGERRDAVPFSDARPIEFPPPIGRRTAHLFPWSDVVYYPKALGVSSASERSRAASRHARTGAETVSISTAATTTVHSGWRVSRAFEAIPMRLERSAVREQHDANNAVEMRLSESRFASVPTPSGMPKQRRLRLFVRATTSPARFRSAADAFEEWAGMVEDWHEGTNCVGRTGRCLCQMARRRVGLFLHDRLNGYQLLLLSDAEQAAVRHGLRLTVESAEKDADRQVRQVRDALALPAGEQPSLVLVSPVRDTDLLPLVAQAARQSFRAKPSAGRRCMATGQRPGTATSSRSGSIHRGLETHHGW